MGLTTISNVLQCVPLAVIVLVPQTDFYDGFYKGTKAGAFPIVLCRFLLRSSICLGYTFCFFSDRQNCHYWTLSNGFV